jgi:hypothetical protein
MRIVALAGMAVVVLAACSGGGGAEVVTGGGSTAPPGGTLPGLDSAAPVWRYAPWAPAPASTATLSAALGGAPSMVEDPQSSWTFSPPAPTVPGGGPGTPQQVATALWAAIGIDPATLAVSVSADGRTVTGVEQLGGVPSPLPFVVTVDGAGNIASASGHIVRPDAAGDQARIGTVAALAQVAAPRAGDDRGEQQPSLRPDPKPAVPPLSPDPTTRPTTPNPAVVDVAETYVLSPAADGGLWLLPAYQFTFDDGETRTVSAVAAPPEAAGLIGVPEDQAAATAASHGLAFRVAERDGVEQMLTADYDPSRVNVAVTKGLVTRAWMG